MISWYVYQRHVQKRNDVFKIWIGEIPASDNHLNITEMTVVTKAIEAFNDFVAYCKYFHGLDIVP